MLAYATVGSNRLAEAKAFYDALLATAGICAYHQAKLVGQERI